MFQLQDVVVRRNEEKVLYTNLFRFGHARTRHELEHFWQIWEMVVVIVKYDAE
jgi:hypothetical protein